MNKVHAIVLAAGKGTRMKAKTIPKVLFPVSGKPMLAYLLETLKAATIDSPILVVGFLGHKVVDTFGQFAYRYVFQNKRLGTAHAVKAALPLLKDESGATLILNGDHPFYRATTFQRLADAVLQKGATVAVLTGNLNGEEFDAFGRVITDQAGHVLRIVEAKDANEEERSVRLMNLGCYCVDNQWLWQAIKKVKKSPVSGEYYVTDLVSLAVKEDKKIIAIHIENETEAIGINTLDHLADAERVQATAA